MFDASSRDALAGKPGEVDVKSDDTAAGEDRIYCRQCSSDRIFRVFRKGFMEERIYSRFGYFPWRCLSCGSRVLLRRREGNAYGDGEREALE